MRRILNRERLDLVARAVLAVVFAAAAIPKLLNPENFAIDIANYLLLPGFLTGAAAVVMPGVELVAALALLTRRWRRPGALLILIMCIAFLIAIIQALARGLNIECGCFGGILERRVDYGVLIEDSVLALLAFYSFSQAFSGRVD